MNFFNKINKLFLTLFFFLTLTVSGNAEKLDSSTQHIHIHLDEGYSAKKLADQKQERWNETHNLRRKKDKLIEKKMNIDSEKLDFYKKQVKKKIKAINDSETCKKNENLNAYWEENTKRCLDRTTGKTID